MTHFEFITHYSQVFSLGYFVLLFALVVGYALWPRNRETFDEAARLPLEDD